MDAAKKIVAWAHFLRESRHFFDQNGFVEVTTPCLVPAGAFEASIDAFDVATSPPLQLQTSPEMQMKPLLAKGSGPIYQICPSFRNDPDSPIHKKEFTMLEFYRPNWTAGQIASLTRTYFNAISPLPIQWRSVEVRELFLELGLDLERLTDLRDFRTHIEKTGLVACVPSDTWSDLFFRVWIEKIEPNLSADVATLVQGYPVAVSPLTQVKPDAFWTDRFEIYWRGMELCNGCEELQDPSELRVRYEEQTHQRTTRGVSPHPFPENLFETLELGLPPCAGVAVGLDRLFLALQKHQGHVGDSLL